MHLEITFRVKRTLSILMLLMANVLILAHAVILHHAFSTGGLGR